MHDPDSTTFTLDEIIYNQRYIKPSSSLRSQFAYSNNGYLVAGAIVTRVSGMSLEDFIEQRILRPLGMIQSAASYQGCQTNQNLIDAHKLIGDSMRVVARYSSMKDDAAGGIYTNIEEMSQWALMLLNRGKYGPQLSKRLLSESVVNDLFAPQTIIPVQHPGVYQTHFAAYGLGWFLSDVKGYKQIVHSGQDVGMCSEIALIPELGLAIIVLTNSENGASSAIIDQITDSYIGVTGMDWTAKMYDRVQQQERSARAVRDSIGQRLSQQASPALADLQRFVGTYKTSWFGQATISLRGGKLWFAAQRSPQLRGFLSILEPDVFVLKWQNPELDDGVLVHFSSPSGDKDSHFKVETAVPSASYEGLDFIRIKP